MNSADRWMVNKLNQKQLNEVLFFSTTQPFKNNKTVVSVDSVFAFFVKDIYISQISNSKIILQCEHERKGSATYILIYYLSKATRTTCSNNKIK